MRKTIDLLHGPVLSSLTRLAIPIMATSLIQMAYNLTDMIWIGRVGSNAVAAVGAAGMYMWLSNGLVALARMGGQVNVGYALGAGQKETAGESASGALWLCVLMGVIYGLGCALFASPLIGFFHLNSPVVISDARIYLQITCGSGSLFLPEPDFYRTFYCHWQQPGGLFIHRFRTSDQFCPGSGPDLRPGSISPDGRYGRRRGHCIRPGYCHRYVPYIRAERLCPFSLCTLEMDSQTGTDPLHYTDRTFPPACRICSLPGSP